MHYRQNMSWCAFIHLTLNWAINPTNLYPTTQRHSIIPKLLITIKSMSHSMHWIDFLNYVICFAVTLLQSRDFSWLKQRANCGPRLQDCKGPISFDTELLLNIYATIVYCFWNYVNITSNFNYSQIMSRVQPKTFNFTMVDCL